MKKNNFWNEAAKAGAILGIVLAASNLFENGLFFSNSMTYLFLVCFEFIAVAVLHYYLLHRFARSRSRLYTTDEGFTFGEGYSAVLAVSGFAGIIAGAVQAVFLHLIVGYSNYIDHYVGWVTGIFERFGGVPASTEALLAQTISELQTAPAPSLLRTLWGGFFGCLLFGALFGLIIAGVLSRAPKPFSGQDNE